MNKYMIILLTTISLSLLSSQASAWQECNSWWKNGVKHTSCYKYGYGYNHYGHRSHYGYHEGHHGKQVHHKHQGHHHGHHGHHHGGHHGGHHR